MWAAAARLRALGSASDPPTVQVRDAKHAASPWLFRMRRQGLGRPSVSAACSSRSERAVLAVLTAPSPHPASCTFHTLGIRAGLDVDELARAMRSLLDHEPPLVREARSGVEGQSYTATRHAVGLLRETS